MSSDKSDSDSKSSSNSDSSDSSNNNNNGNNNKNNDNDNNNKGNDNNDNNTGNGNKNDNNGNNNNNNNNNNTGNGNGNGNKNDNNGNNNNNNNDNNTGNGNDNGNKNDNNSNNNNNNNDNNKDNNNNGGNNNNNNNNGGNNNNNNNNGGNNNNNDNNEGNNNNNNNGGNNGGNKNNNGGNNDGSNNNNNGNNNNYNNGGNNNYNNNNNQYQTPPPPPPPLHSRPLTPGHRSHASDEKDSNDNSKAIIGGVAAGAVLLLILLLFCCICYCRKKRRKKQQDQMYFNSVDSPGLRRNDYFGNGGNDNTWSKPEPEKNPFRQPQPPTTASSANVSSEYGHWPMAPPPPPPMMTSSELNSINFSGPYGLSQPPPHPSIALGFDKSSFTYEELDTATDGFANSNLLGQGGFGYVYKGVLRTGKEVAVKSLKSGGGQGEREFQAEVDIISRVHHRHLVGLVGYCISGSKRMLVYEYIPNNTLEFHLYGPGNPVMDWPLRVRIALGAAKGFAYLHEDCHPKIIHRDIKASNILLDEHYEAKVSDFGLAKLSADNYTHVSTRIMGTFGYLAPEYASSGKLTEKSDVYSYGVVLLELITGKRPIDIIGGDETLIDWARPILIRASDGGNYEELVDKKLQNNYDPQQMQRMVTCAAACIRHSGRRRPKMSQILRTLEGNASLDDLQDKGKAGINSDTSSADYDSHSYNINFRSTGMSSHDSSSSEHGLSSGEHDPHTNNKTKRVL